MPLLDQPFAFLPILLAPLSLMPHEPLSPPYPPPYRLLMRAHHRALASSQAFWRLLLHHSVRFHEVHAALMHIRKSHMLAQSTYRVVRGGGRGDGSLGWGKAPLRQPHMQRGGKYQAPKP